MKVLALFVLVISVCLAQGNKVKLGTQTEGTLPSTQGGLGTIPGTSLPSTCVVGQLFVKTNATPGSNIYVCTALPGTWTVVSGSGGGGGFTGFATVTGTTARTYTFPTAPNSITTILDTLTASVTSGTVTGGLTDGQLVCSSIAQNGTGGWSYVFPTTMINFALPDTQASAVTTQCGIYRSATGNITAITSAVISGLGGIGQFLKCTEGTTPAPPPAGQITIYCKTSDNSYHILKSDGSDFAIGTGGGGGTVTVVGAGNLTNTACVTGGGAQTLRTPTSGTECNIDSSGNVTGLTFSATSTGNGLISAGNIRAALGAAIFWNGSTVLSDVSNGVLSLRDTAQTSFGRLCFGPCTSSFPAWKRNGAGFLARVGDDTNDAIVNFLNLKRGAGTPEAAVTGVVGDLYQRTDGGASTSLYLKESGAGNTGWVPLGSGGTGSPGGSTTQFQYNNMGSFGGLSTWTTNGTDVTATGSIDLTAATVALPAVHVRTDTGFTMTAGQKIVGNLSASTAGFRLVAGSIPSTLVGGDFAITTAGRFCTYDGTNINCHPYLAGSGVTAATAPTTGNLVRWGATYSQTDAGAASIVAADIANSAVTSVKLNITTTTCSNQFVRSISATAVGTCASVAVADLPAADFNTGTSKTFSLLGGGYFECTSTCTITMPVPAAGKQYCVRNANNVATVITFAAIGSSSMYEVQAKTSYGTAGTGTFVSGGAIGDQVCFVGKDSTHYDIWSISGTWTAN